MDKKFYISDMSQWVGKEVDSYFYCNSVKINMSTSGKKHAAINLSDKTGTVEAKIWSESLTGKEKELEGKVVRVLAMVNLFNGLPSFIIAVAQPAQEGSYDMDELVKTLTDEEKAKLTGRLQSYINVCSEPVKELLNCIFGTDTVNKFLTLPAGLKHHHAFNGGLMVHTLEVADIAASFCNVQDRFASVKGYSRPINKDLIIAGALLHDLGKIDEYTSFPNAKIGVTGHLEGHLVSGVLAVERALRACGPNLDDLVVEQIKHIILASHGADGVLLPQTLEAIIVSNADGMSAATDYYSLFCEEYSKVHDDTEQFAYSPVKGQAFMRR